MRAKDLMVTEFDKIFPEATVQEAIRKMRFARYSRRGRRIFGLVVVDKTNHPMGMISMSDIFHHVRPPFKKMWEDKVGLAWYGQFEAACGRAKKSRVGDIMNRTVISVEESATITEIIDLMTKHRIRRMPVLRRGVVCGIVYISDIFQEVAKKLLPQTAT